MKWKPIPKDKLIEMINESYERMDLEQRKIWDIISIIPIKWKQKPWGKIGKGFWIVAIIGNNVIWYNDIEEGFNISEYKIFGEIDEYYCNHDELEHSVQQVINFIKDGYFSGFKAGAPKPL